MLKIFSHSHGPQLAQGSSGEMFSNAAFGSLQPNSQSSPVKSTHQSSASSQLFSSIESFSSSGEIITSQVEKIKSLYNKVLKSAHVDVIECSNSQTLSTIKGESKLHSTSRSSDRPSFELTIDAQAVVDSSGSPPSTSTDPKKNSPASICSPSWLSVASDKSKSSGQDQLFTNDETEIGPSSGHMEIYTDSIQPDKAGIYICHLCQYTGKSKMEFQQHLRIHYEYHCPKCDYTSRTEGRLRRHIDGFHSEVRPGNFSGKTTKRPAKPKTQRCKQCDFVAQTKEELWVHQRIHIKKERQLNCPYCSFVTEYRHHFEYHVRNHAGIKPFKCSKCNYECVNKSMLNSHMKSHTNVYQYRCSDCKYAAKYCHSLRQHLSKNKHSKPVVLNVDGSLPEKATTFVIQPESETPRRTQFPDFTALDLLPALPPLSFNVPQEIPALIQFPSLFESLFNSISVPVSVTTPAFAIPPPQLSQALPISVQTEETPLDLSASKSSIPATKIEDEPLAFGNLMCEFCLVVFPDTRTHSKHMSAHDSHDPLRCKSCEFRCTPQTNLFDHLRASKCCED